MKAISILVLSALASAQSSHDGLETCTTTGYVIPDPTTAFVTPTGNIPSPTILRPSQGEVVTIGQPYTIEWTPQTASGHISLELHSERGSGNGLLPCGYGCTGWAINTECRKLSPLWLPEGGTSVVWNIANDTEYESHSDRDGSPYWNVLVVYVGANFGTSQNARWHAETRNFSFVNPWANVSSSSSVVSLPTSTSLSSTSTDEATETMTETEEAMETETETGARVATPTGAASSMFYQWRNVLLNAFLSAFLVTV